ncbi:hypothetical protein V1264_006216 [Littorina saxatilis]|uniref:Integrase catalytic domain-containing protein n=1 Tax=Littorina saxatilis TaxID=31220 RepID=A0AAN9AWL7_9CAEN
MITDHRPLLNIWEKPFPPARIARWSLRLQPYDVHMEYRPGKDNPADYLSRHPGHATASSHEEKIAEEFVNFTAMSSTPDAITLEDVQTATANDPVLQAIMKCVNSGRWHENTHGIAKETFTCFRNIKDSLCVNAQQNILLKGSQLVIPSSLQARVVDLAHEGHHGMNKTKALLRSKVWFPGINAAVESAVRSCIPCQANNNRREHQPLLMSNLPCGPWQELSIDFCGPLPSGASLLVITDEYSRYPVVEVLQNTTVETVIPVVDKVFSLFGYPAQVKTDNGPQFISKLWKQFMQSCGVKHRRITPLWPKANPQAETFNKPMMKAVRSAHVERRSWRQELHKFCRVYRATPHCTTSFTPYFLMFGREPRTKLPEVQSNSLQHPADAEVRLRDTFAKQKMKCAADKRHHAKDYNIEPGDSVLVKQMKQNKLSTNFNPTPLLVTDTKGSMITAQKPDGSTVTRNSSLFRRLPPSVTPQLVSNKEVAPVTEAEETTRTDHEEAPTAGETDDDVPPSTTPSSHGSVPPASISPRRSKRNRTFPQHMKDYICVFKD